MKINELSKELGRTNKEVITYLKDQGYRVSSHNQNANADMVSKAKDYFSSLTAQEAVAEDESKDMTPAAVVQVQMKSAPAAPTRKFALDEYIPCRSVTPWSLTLLGVDKNTVYTWDYFGAEEMVMYRDLQSWRKKACLTDPYIIIEDDDLRNAWRQDLAPGYRALANVDYPEELFDMETPQFIEFLKSASTTVCEVVKSTAISMIRAENFPDLDKILAIDSILGTDIQDFLSK